MDQDSRFPILPGVEHRFVDLPGGLRMHVAEAGHGDPVLLLHGFPQHWWEWRGVIPGLAEHHRVIVPDLRGTGWTDAPETGYDRVQLVADVVALLDALEIDRVHLVGHDWGALISYNLCFEHPERVRSFLCVAIPHPFIRFDVRALPAFRHLWFQQVVAAPGVGPWLLRSGRQRLVRRIIRGFSSPQTTWTDDDLDAYADRMREPARARAASSLYRGLILPELVRIARGRYRDQRLTTPTVILCGADDPVMRVEFLGGYENNADDLTIEVVPNASHFIPDEQPDAVAAHALELIART
jgi:pimeloyl-ACP methyl ester carboxylesterase